MIPYLNKISFPLAITFFTIWLISINSRIYLALLASRSKNKFNKENTEINSWNKENPNHQIEVTSSWLDIYKAKLSNRHTFLLLSFIFAYISFNITAYYETNIQEFYQLLTISTTLFLAGLTYIRKLYDYK